MKQLVSDREGGLVSESTSVWAERWGIALLLRAPGQHATLVERHHELLRQLIHRIEAQCLAEGLQVSFGDIVAEGLLAKNCLFTIGDKTPYTAVFGRQPPLLPEAENPTVSQVDDTDGGATARHIVRLREIAVQTMVEQTALQRIQRAANSKTLRAGEQLNLKVGDLVDVFRPAKQKDAPGWRGPARVIGLHNLSEGFADVSWGGRSLGVRVQDLRPANMYPVLIGQSEAVVDIVRRHAQSISNNLEVHCMLLTHKLVGGCPGLHKLTRPSFTH